MVEETNQVKLEKPEAINTCEIGDSSASVPTYCIWPVIVTQFVKTIFRINLCCASLAGSDWLKN